MSLKIGVAIPTHTQRISNGMLARAVQSVMFQRLPPAQINVAVDTERRGAPHTRQRALDGITEEWTAFLDSDDEFMAEHLQVLSNAQEETGADYVYSWFNLLQFGHNLGYDPVFPPTHYSEPWDDVNPRQTTMTILVRTELAKDVGFWEPADEQKFADGHRVGEDWIFTLDCLERGAKIHHVVQRTWNWHHHGLNTSGRATQGDAQ